MSRFSWRVSCLLLLPLLIFVVPLLIRPKHEELPIGNTIAGGWDKDAIGERAALSEILLNLNRYPQSNFFISTYSTPEADGKYMKEVARGIRPDIEWIYTLEYKRREVTLVKRLYVDPRAPEKVNKTWVWKNVSYQAIRRVAGPVLALKTTFQVEAYKGGNLSDLRRFGAVLEEQKQH